ncbi:hypothetical protein ASE48_08530 [Mycobacterium sp. Root265]|uniref:hypothetical protein n=1 Tax=Mycobacterium sp. Root265 TaxID=1736504 RepID=UPI000710E019|nr:hypothetical protein [Mycobacterium sp. Root265]KRD08600.1 hypothetical protein ASE48_08530 [Mycobacterium sp. Root265]
MNIEDIAKLQAALERWDAIIETRDRFIAKNDDPKNFQPLCGWEDYDEALTDFKSDLVDAGEQLAQAIKEILG